MQENNKDAAVKKLELLVDFRNRFLAAEEKKINQRRELQMHGQAMALIIDLLSEANWLFNHQGDSPDKTERSPIIKPF